MVTISGLYTPTHSDADIFIFRNGILLYTDLTDNIVEVDLLKRVSNVEYVEQAYLTSGLTVYDRFNKSSYTVAFFNLNTYLFLKKYYFYSFNFYWTKITFRGKGFRVRFFRKSKKFLFNFGHSHWTRLRLTTAAFRVCRMRRALFILIMLNKIQFYTLSNLIRVVRKVNKYTKRGLRLKKQLIQKRFGKISQVVSSLQA